MAETVTRSRTRTDAEDDADSIERLYQDVSAATDRVYDEIASDIESFFRNRDPVYNAIRENGADRDMDPLVAEGRVSVRVDGSGPEPFYVAEEFVGSPDDGNTVPRRYVPNGGTAEDTLRDLYAPLAVAAEQLAYCVEYGPESDAYDVSEIRDRLEHPVTEGDARTVLNMTSALYGRSESMEVERTAYTVE